MTEGIEPLLLRFPDRRSVVRGAPLAGMLPAMMLPAAERTAQVPPACVAGMREEANPAIRAGSRTITKPGVGTARSSPARPDIAGQAGWRGRPDANPRETRKTSRWLWQKGQALDDNVYRFTHTLVLPLRRQCFERQGEVFMRTGREFGKTARTNVPPPIAYPRRPPCRINAAPLRKSHPETTTWKKEPIFFFPSSRAI